MKPFHALSTDRHITPGLLRLAGDNTTRTRLFIKQSLIRDDVRFYESQLFEAAQRNGDLPEFAGFYRIPALLNLIVFERNLISLALENHSARFRLYSKSFCSSISSRVRQSSYLGIASLSSYL